MGFNQIENFQISKRDELSDKVIGFLDRIKAFEYIKDIKENNVEKPTFEEFKQFLVRINGIAREIPIKERGIDGKDVRLEGFVDTVLVPEEKDKEILLKYAYDNLDKIDNKEKKYFLPAVVTGVHLFSDGNGRTSRVLYQALDEHASNEDLQKEIKKTLSKDGRYITMDVNPSFVSSEVEMLVLKRYGWKFENNSWLKKELGEIKNGIFTGEEDNLDMNNPSYVFAEKFIEYAGIDGSSACTAVYASLDKETLKSILTSVYENKDGISPLLMQDNLSLKQWVDIIEKFNDLKKEYLQTFIDSFIEPEKFKAISEDMTIKDLFIKRVQENYKEFNS